MRIYYIAYLTIIFLSNFLSAATEQNKNVNLTSDYFKKNLEVYYSFSVNSISKIKQLANIISIDNIEGTTVHAYANEKEWQRFLTHKLDYTVLTHPGDLYTNPIMYDGNPGESFEWDKYPTYDEYINMMYQFETEYPGLCKIYEIGESHNGRKMLVAKVSDNVNADEAEPGFLSASTMHGDETCGFLLMLRMIDYLCSNYNSDPQARRIVDSIEMWISPNLNPDGTYHGGNHTVTGARRGNANAIDINRNFPNHIGGPHPDGNAYQKETEACLAFESQHHLVMGADLHGGVECALTPWACQFSKPLDNDWFLFIARQYADLAQRNSPSGYFTGSTNGVGNGAEGLYTAKGIRLDWQLHYNHCRGLTIEMSNSKVLPENKLRDFWDFNKESLISFYEQVLNGIRGIVMDSISYEPLAAKVFVENLDKDSNHVYSRMPHGDYYRPIFKGRYDVTFSSNGYLPKTIKNIVVENNKATIVNVLLEPWPNAVNTNQHNHDKKLLNITSEIKGILINWNKIGPVNRVVIYSINGQVIKTFSLKSTNRNTRILWNGLNDSSLPVGKGCYVVQVETVKNVYSKRFIK